MEGGSVNKESSDLGPDRLNEVTRVPLRRQRAVHFAGFLTDEDDAAVYIADTQGTWVIPRENVDFIEDWRDGEHCAPDYMKDAGRPVRVGVSHGATVHEIRPWKFEVDLEHQFHKNVRRAAAEIFSLGGEDLPIGKETLEGERKLAALEQLLSRQLGWNPDDPCTGPVAGGRGPGGGYDPTVAGGSHTIVVNDGYCDADPGF